MRFFIFCLLVFSFLFSDGQTAVHAEEVGDESAAPDGSEVQATEDYRNPFSVNPLFMAQTAADALKPREIVTYKGLVLEGIAMGPNERMAVINGQTYHEGQIRQGLELVAVRKAEVDVKEGISLRTLKMNETTSVELSKSSAQAESQSFSGRATESETLNSGLSRGHF